jgi:hypothetical protein
VLVLEGTRGRTEDENEDDDEDECRARRGRAGQGKRAQNQPLLATAYSRARTATFLPSHKATARHGTKPR